MKDQPTFKRRQKPTAAPRPEDVYGDMSRRYHMNAALRRERERLVNYADGFDEDGMFKQARSYGPDWVNDDEDVPGRWDYGSKQRNFGDGFDGGGRGF